MSNIILQSNLILSAPQFNACVNRMNVRIVETPTEIPNFLNPTNSILFGRMMSLQRDEEGKSLEDNTDFSKCMSMAFDVWWYSSVEEVMSRGAFIVTGVGAQLSMAGRNVEKFQGEG
jgi:hypothetical protein